MDIKQFAEAWIAAWNSHQLDDILSHYAEDIEVCTPMIKLATGIDSGKLIGKPAVKNYWERALQKLPDLHFELLDVTEGVDSIAIYYKSVMNKICIEVMFFNPDGKINRMYAHYRD